MTQQPDLKPILAPGIIDSERLIGDLETLKVFFNPMRAQIMRAMAERPRSVQEIADEMNIPFTRLYYHIKMLERHELIQLVDTRTLSGAVEEKYYQVTAQCYRVHRSLMSFSVHDEAVQFVEESMDDVFDDARTNIRDAIVSGDVNLLEQAPSPQSLLIQRKLASLTSEQAEQFSQRLLDLLDEFESSEPIEQTHPYNLSIVLSPLKSTG